jgi:hypothetical protein
MKKEKHLRIRITESQFTRLIDTIHLTEEISKSEFIRQAINEKIEREKISEKHNLKRV